MTMSFFDQQAIHSAPAGPPAMPRRIQNRIWAGLVVLLLVAAVLGSAMLF
ncbi:hypothetical protein L615_009000000120 [Nocardioides sp. J9]|nr:hypothetical protein L615_009000000120 [Nocardioides sp. J9]